jgi:diaminohydroxyphosphoribosylaminopyrimidine deaminase/5-amino-6-(5-phosphoribosylamino)uracil reductase
MVDGKGIQKLESAGRTVITGVLEKECIELNKRFYTYHIKKRPYIILKWAQTKDGYVDFVRQPDCGAKAFWITNEYCKTLVHKWRTEEDAFLVGTNTVLLDDPQLTARNWSGRNPKRIVIDEHCQFDKTYQIFDNQADTIIINSLKDSVDKNVRYIKIDFTQNIILQILNVLYDNQIQSLVVEGGSQTLESFILAGMWDEARVFTGDHVFGKGVPAPQFNYTANKAEVFGNSELRWYFK